MRVTLRSPLALTVEHLNIWNRCGHVLKKTSGPIVV
jgi:hypothetical protein